eukprot:GHVQ01015898.1.p1 GENE.GHVQ01015898.1~~GHVQ01015898.1.p1  ORF type:complete len:504 (-),score=86.57 GHVQ01015898.1:599-2110(-)
MASFHSSHRDDRKRGRDETDDSRDSRKKDEDSSQPKKGIGFKALRRERQRIMQDHFGYTDDNNPFGDSSLAEPFIWKKKNAYLKAAGKLTLPTPMLLVEQAQRKVSEIESVKKRREDRELEEKLLLEQREQLEREREQENYEEWAQKEEQFHMEQALKKTQIRLDQGRERPVDLLVKSLKMLNGEVFSDTSLLESPPPDLIAGMSKTELADFLADVRVHYQVEGANNDEKIFWKSLVLLIGDAQNKLGQAPLSGRPGGRDAESGVAYSVVNDIHKLLGSKSRDQLDVLESQVDRKLSRRDESIDPAYWEAIQDKIPFYKARAEVMGVHVKSQCIARELRAKKEEAARAKLEAERPEKDDEDNGDEKQLDAEDADAGSYSPVLEPYGDDDPEPLVRGPCSPLLISYEDFAKLISGGGSQQLSLQLLDPVEERERRYELKAQLVECVVARRKEQQATSKADLGPGGSWASDDAVGVKVGGDDPEFRGLPGLSEDDPNMASVRSTT